MTVSSAHCLRMLQALRCSYSHTYSDHVTPLDKLLCIQEANGEIAKVCI